MLINGRSKRAKRAAYLCAAAAAAVLIPAGGSCEGGKPAKPAAEAAAQPDARSLQLNERGVAAVKAREFGEAEQLFRQALAADPYNLTAVFNLAGMYATNNKTAEAAKLLEAYVKKSPEDAGLNARLADIYFSMQRPKDAAEYYETALKLDPRYPRLHARLATVYGLQNRTRDAEQHVLAALQEEPSNPELYANLSALQLANGNVQGAIASAKKSLQLKASADVYVTLGTAYELSRSVKNALIAYQRAVDLGDERPELKQKIESLKKAGAME